MFFLSLRLKANYVFSNGMNLIVKKHLFVLHIMLIHSIIKIFKYWSKVRRQRESDLFKFR